MPQKLPEKREAEPFFKKDLDKSRSNEQAFFNRGGTASPAQAPQIQRQPLEPKEENTKEPEEDQGTTPSPTAGTTPLATKFDAERYHQSFRFFDLTYVPLGPSPEEGTLTVKTKVFFDMDEKVKESIKTSFPTDFESKVESTWSEQHPLVLRDAPFEVYKAKVKVDIQKVESKDDAHFTVRVAPRKKNFRSSVNWGKEKAELSPEDATNNEELKVSRGDFFKQVGPFGFDNFGLNSDVKSGADEAVSYIKSLPKEMIEPDDIMGMMGISYTGRASSEGSKSYNKKLSKKRIETVSNYIEAEIPELMAIALPDPAGETHTEEEEKYRRVDVKIILPTTNDKRKTKQNTAAHEAGHMFGLDDEYVEEDEGHHRFEGDKPLWYEQVKEVAGEEAAEEMRVSFSDSIMSHGMKVLKGHYVTFALRLKELTGKDWKIE